MKPKGFTLIEMMIVVVTIMIMVCILLPRMIELIEYSKSIEALTNFSYIRQSVERCMAFEKSYRKCATFSKVDFGNPSNVTNSHFNYEFTDVTRYGYKILATRNNWEGGDGLSTIALEQTRNEIIRSGTGVFSRIR